MELSGPLIPRQLLVGNPARVLPQISPDGQVVSFLAPLEGALNIWIAPVACMADARPVTRDTKRGIRSYGWTHTGRHLWYLQDHGGDENFHLHVASTTGESVVNLTPFTNVQTRIVGFSRSQVRSALIAINRRDPRWHDVFRVDLLSGELELIYENNEFSQFICDDELKLRLALKGTTEGGMEVFLPTAEGGWRKFFDVGREDAITTAPVAMGPAGEAIAYFLDSRGRNTAAAVAIDLDSGQTTVLGEHPATDVLGLEINPVSRRVEACHVDYLEPEWILTGTALEEDFRRLSQLGLGHFQLTSRSDDDRKWIVTFTDDREPARYWLYDRHSGGASQLFVARPDLEGWPLSPMRSVIIRSRDGLDLVSYLTLPVDAPLDEEGRPIEAPPMVLLVHGGPWSRNTFGYNPEHQLLANRGYAVLSVNYRGSKGFGKDFVNAGDREWAGKMHDDLIDAVNWAIESGVARRDKIAIMGGSYGGYATLVGLTFTPEVFACGIDIVGPSNLETLLASFPSYWVSLFETFALRTGDPRTEEGRKLLRERSPLHRSDRIVRPLLIAQGANDVRVTRAEADQIVTAMQRGSKPVTYVLYPDEGHGFGRPENRLSFMAITEAFLATFLGGRCQPFEHDLDGSSLEVLAGPEFIHGLNDVVGKTQRL